MSGGGAAAWNHHGGEPPAGNAEIAGWQDDGIYSILDK